jgi:hypothetical protein
MMHDGIKEMVTHLSKDQVTAIHDSSRTAKGAFVG